MPALSVVSELVLPCILHCNSCKITVVAGLVLVGLFWIIVLRLM
jgi:hypothetical protein